MPLLGTSGRRTPVGESKSATALALALLVSALVVGCVCGGLGGVVLGWWLS
jgi:hypothetical protein